MWVIRWESEGFTEPSVGVFAGSMGLDLLGAIEFQHRLANTTPKLKWMELYYRDSQGWRTPIRRITEGKNW